MRSDDQLEFEPTEAQARHDDPVTSQIAAAEMVTGEVERAIWLCCAPPGRTIFEVCTELVVRWPPTTISPRFRPMWRKRYLHEFGTRRNPKTGKMAIVWVQGTLS